MPLTDEQNAIISCDDQMIIEACPGSGKTHTMSYKVADIIDRDLVSAGRRIACITYTNAGADEIEERVRARVGGIALDKVDVCTIHSFCYRHILLPYRTAIFQNFSAIEIVDKADDWWVETVGRVCERHNVSRNDQFSIREARKDLDGRIIVPPGVPRDVIDELQLALDDNNKFLIDDILLLSRDILDALPFVRKVIAAKFEWFIIDEYQDTSVIQIDLLDRIMLEGKSKLTLIGDSNQSIMRFAGADCDAAKALAQRYQLRTDLTLTNSFRCSHDICLLSNRLVAPDSAMATAREEAVTDSAPIHRTFDTALEAILMDFIPAVDAAGIPREESAILVPWFNSMLDLGRDLRDANVRIAGPGRRPYRITGRETMRFFEIIAAFIYENRVDLVSKAVRSLRMIVSQYSMTPVLESIELRRIFIRISSSIQAHTDPAMEFRRWLDIALGILRDYLINEGIVDRKDFGAIQNEVALCYADIDRRARGFLVEPASSFADIQQQEGRVNLMTTHASKGKEFTAVALVEVIEGKYPHFSYYRTRDPVMLEDTKKLLYVGVTRARGLLRIYSQPDRYRGLQPSRFLNAGYLGLA